MLRIFLPIAFLLIVSTVRKIPKIGGNVGVAFFGAGLIAFVMGGVFDLSTWASAWFAQVKTFAFSIFVLVFGSIYAKMLIKSGTLDALLNVFRAAFGKTARGLVAVVLLVLWITGALIGNVTAVATLVGVLVIPLLADIGMSANMICAVILSGAALGALQPPVSSAINMALSLMQMEDITDTMNLFYVTIPIGIVLVILFFIFVYVNPKKHSISPELLPTEKAGAIFRRTWKSFISVFVLFGFAVLASFPGVKLDIMGNLLKTGKSAQDDCPRNVLSMAGRHTDSQRIAKLHCPGPSGGYAGLRSAEQGGPRQPERVRYQRREGWRKIDSDAFGRGVLCWRLQCVGAGSDFE